MMIYYKIILMQITMSSFTIAFNRRIQVSVQLYLPLVLNTDVYVSDTITLHVSQYFPPLSKKPETVNFTSMFMITV